MRQGWRPPPVWGWCRGEVFRLGQDSKTATGKAADVRSGSAAGSKPGAVKVLGKDRDMSSALRSVYQTAVEEPIPDDLLDLLGKLG